MIKKLKRAAQVVNKAGKSAVGRQLINAAIGATPYASQIKAGRKLLSGRGIYRGRGIYTGAGEYVADSNALIASSGSKSSMSVVPQFVNEGDAGYTLSRREYVSEIYGPSTSFAVQSFPLNPGLEGTFPWLSQIAQNYDEYSIEQLIFTFKSTTTESGNTVNGQVGTVIMATQYNAAAQNFTDKVTMMQYAFSNSGKLTESLQHGVECDPAKLSGSAGEYIRNNPVVTGQDVKTYDHGKFQIAVANCAAQYANVSIGELWVSYTVRLRKPKFYSALGLGISKDIYCSSGGETIAVPFGSNLLRGQQNNIGCRITQPTANKTVITFPGAFKGYIKVMYSIGSAIISATGVASVYTAAAMTLFAGVPYELTGNVRAVADLYGNSSNAGEVSDLPANTLWQSNVATGILLIAHFEVNIATGGVDNSVAFTHALTAAAGTVPSQCYLEIAEFNSGYSYFATGLSTTTNDAPVFVSSGGVVTIPA